MMLMRYVAPERGGGSRGDGDSALLLLDHPVHGGSAVVHLTDLVGDAGVIEDALGRRRFTGVDVSHDPDVPRFFEWYLTWHDVTYLFATTNKRSATAGRRRAFRKLRLLLFPVARSGTAEPAFCVIRSRRSYGNLDGVDRLRLAADVRTPVQLRQNRKTIYQR